MEPNTIVIRTIMNKGNFAYSIPQVFTIDLINLSLILSVFVVIQQITHLILLDLPPVETNRGT